jgi:hypothetical protein
MSETLEIAVHLADGSVRRFACDGADAVRRALGRLHPDRVFDEPVLAIGSRLGMSTFRRAAILRVEVRGPVPDDWTHGPGIEAVAVVDEADFRAEQRTIGSPREVRTGDPYHVHAEVLQVGGESLFLRVDGRIAPEAVRVHRIERLMDRPCLHGRRSDGTAVLIQLENVAMLAVRPVVQLPTKVIEADGIGAP